MRVEINFDQVLEAGRQKWYFPFAAKSFICHGKLQTKQERQWLALESIFRKRTKDMNVFHFEPFLPSTILV
jgi:hypothetical protein